MAITKISPYEMGDYHSFGQNVGKSFGAGINHAVSGLAQAKLNTLLAKQQKQDQWHEREQAYTQAVAGGLSPEDARIVASAAPEDRINYWKILAGSRRSPEAGQNPMSSEMGGPQQQEQQSLQQLLQQGGQQGNGQDAVMQNLMKLLGGQQGQQMMQQSQSPQQVNQMLQPNAQTSQQGQMTTAEKFAGYETPQIKQARLKMEQQERQFQQKEKREEKKLTHVRQREIDKETLPVYKKINEDAKAAKSNNLRLDRMQQLVDKGKLVGNELASFVSGLEKIPGIGGIIASTAKAFHYNPDSLEFEKLTFDFLKDAKSIFGSRLTNYDVESFLKTVPTLALSRVGKKRVIHNLRLFNDAAEIRQKALRSVIKENGGERPRDLDSQVEEKASKELDKIAELFKRGYVTPTAA